VYQVGINKGIILRCTAYQISKSQTMFTKSGSLSHKWEVITTIHTAHVLHHIIIIITIIIIWHYNPLWVFAFSAKSLQVLLSLAVSFQILTSRFFKSSMTSSCHRCLGLPTGLVPIGLQSNSFPVGLARSILWICPSHLILCALMNLTISASSSSSVPFTPCGAYGIHEALPSVAISSHPLDHISWSSCISYFVLYCPSPRSLQPTFPSVPLRIPIQCSFLYCYPLLYVMCVQSSSIFFFLSEFLLASVWWSSIVLHL